MVDMGLPLLRLRRRCIRPRERRPYLLISHRYHRVALRIVVHLRRRRILLAARHVPSEGRDGRDKAEMVGHHACGAYRACRRIHVRCRDVCLDQGDVHIFDMSSRAL